MPPPFVLVCERLTGGWLFQRVSIPIRRLNLAIGESAAVRAAWLRFPELRLEPLEQLYTREAERRFRYQSRADGEPFTAILETDSYGRVLRYEGLWEAEQVEPDA